MSNEQLFENLKYISEIKEDYKCNISDKSFVKNTYWNNFLRMINNGCENRWYTIDFISWNIYTSINRLGDDFCGIDTRLIIINYLRSIRFSLVNLKKTYHRDKIAIGMIVELQSAISNALSEYQ